MMKVLVCVYVGILSSSTTYGPASVCDKYLLGLEHEISWSISSL